ncbi:hypothetical protein KC363_g2842 [Hortaea werneckii]|uniref:Uncharacterized protein n=1 Tax=Hortaea werneckii TaxID=91943 RepID=A0A3M7FNN4_HORWE|nr:hypothetical protein KC325_g3654 [Hortaea werneckii]KAI6999572.1 hypothetical protein KC359_g1678 [Hortaea werneckii]KAI7086042.1 hypothetical protein KC356_g5392 [Hortaea werneckii]KAI7146638.1 hypothetical protein KC344_g3434 [Hortaea werneckii]KAI7175234.1 hypothetical protein KC360_g3748 [Hortaea werneckii]
MASMRSLLRLAPRAHLARPATNTTRTLPVAQQQRTFMFQSHAADDRKKAQEAEEASEDLAGGNEDPNMNGNYPDPTLTSALPVKRQFRDPYADWWDPQERRNYGETVHEDNDVLGVFSPEAYTHFSTGWGGVLMGSFIATVGALCGIVYNYYPDRASVPRTYPGGLEAELGGPEAPRAAMTEADMRAIIEGDK